MTPWWRWRILRWCDGSRRWHVPVNRVLCLLADRTPSYRAEVERLRRQVTCPACGSCWWFVPLTTAPLVRCTDPYHDPR